MKDKKAAVNALLPLVYHGLLIHHASNGHTLIFPVTSSISIFRNYLEKLGSKIRIKKFPRFLFAVLKKGHLIIDLRIGIDIMNDISNGF